jgi:hypothetical protein
MILVAALLVGSTSIPCVYASTVITFDSSASNYCTAGTCGLTLSWEHTVGSGSSRILVVGVAINDPFVATASVAYGASSLNLLLNPSNQIAMFYLLDPPIGTSTVTVTFTGITDYLIAGRSVSYFNVAGAGTSTSSHGSGTPASVSVTSNNGELVVDVLGAGGAAYPVAAGAGQTLRWSDPTVGAMSDKDASSPTTTMTYILGGGTYDGDWDMIAAVLLPQMVIPNTPVGGVVVPKNSLEILTPYIALAGLIAAISTAYVIKKQK